MSEQNKLIQARATYNTLCKFLDDNGWRYAKDEEELSIECSACGEDLSMPITVRVYADRQVTVLISHLPFEIPDDKRLDAAIALCEINSRIVDGSFDYDIVDGRVYFRMTNSFSESALSTEVFNYMVLCSCATIDEYNDKLLMLVKGVVSLEQFIKDLMS